MKLRRIIGFSLAGIGALLILAGLIIGSTWWYLHPKIERIDGVVYGQRLGHKLAFDILRPSNPNGVGIVLMASGRWESSAPGSFQAWITAPILRRGYTIFAVYHVSQPEATVMEIVEDMHRAVRHIRHHAAEYRVDPKRLGVVGGSSGGHLSLMLATRGGPGPANAVDPVDRETSAVQAVAIFYPVTDLLNLGDSTENLHDGGPPKSFVKAFGPQSTNLPIWTNIAREMSPICFMTSNLPPTLIYHGDADTLVPLDQSQRFQQAANKVGRDVKLNIHAGGKHGWYSMIWDVRQFAAWFDRHLRPR
jgi:acetyl esterase/lipase